MIERAHAHGLRIIGATLTPFGDSFAGTPFEGYYTPEKEKIRVALNDFIAAAFDGVIDFDAAHPRSGRPPPHPGRIQQRRQPASQRRGV